MQIPIWRLTKLFILVKFIQIVNVYFTPQQFDISSEIIIKENELSKESIVDESLIPTVFNHILTHIVEKFITWDTVYFSDLFINDIKYEHQFVFCPLYWRLIKLLPIGEGNFYKKLILSLVITNALHYLSVILLYVLTIVVFSKYISKKEVLAKVSFISSTLFIISPAGIFLTASYSESPCCFLSLLTLLLREISLNYKNFNLVNSKTSIKHGVIFKISYLMSGLLCALNYGVRANSALLGILYLYDLFEFLFRNKDYKNSFFAIISGSQLFFSIVLANWYNYKVFCPDRKEWCSNMFPSLFSFAQAYYWNHGFFNYWTLNNIPNFLFALPTIITNMLSFRYFYHIKPYRSLLPYILISMALVIGGVFFWHVQTLTRIFSFLPLTNWFIAYLYVFGDQTEVKLAKYFVTYYIIWNFFQAGLFASFLPPA